MVGCINLLHLHLRVDIAVVEEVDIGDFNLSGCKQTQLLSHIFLDQGQTGDA